MSHMTVTRGDEIHYGMWIILDASGSARMTRREPDVARGEVAVYTTVRVPKSLFRKPLLKAEVTVPPQAGITEADAIRVVADVVHSGVPDFEVEVTGRSEP